MSFKPLYLLFPYSVPWSSLTKSVLSLCIVIKDAELSSDCGRVVALDRAVARTLTRSLRLCRVVDDVVEDGVVGDWGIAG